MRIKNFLNTIKVFLISYIISSFVTTCSLLIYLSSLMETLGHEFTEVEIREASIITFNNILIIALLFTFLYYIVKKITVDIPIKKIKNCQKMRMKKKFQKLNLHLEKKEKTKKKDKRKLKNYWKKEMNYLLQWEFLFLLLMKQKLMKWTMIIPGTLDKEE